MSLPSPLRRTYGLGERPTARSAMGPRPQRGQPPQETGGRGLARRAACRSSPARAGAATLGTPSSSGGCPACVVAEVCRVLAARLNASADALLLVVRRARLPGYAAATPDTLQRRFLSTRGEIITSGDVITVRLSRRTYSPVLRQANPPPPRSPGGATAPCATNSPDVAPDQLRGNPRLGYGAPRTTSGSCVCISAVRQGRFACGRSRLGGCPAPRRVGGSFRGFLVATMLA